jgi:hypothetical protein
MADGRGELPGWEMAEPFPVGNQTAPFSQPPFVREFVDVLSTHSEGPYYGPTKGEARDLIEAGLLDFKPRSGARPPNPTSTPRRSPWTVVVEEPGLTTMKGFGPLMTASIGINVADAVIKKDPDKAAAIGASVLGSEAFMIYAVGAAGAASLPVAVSVGGFVGAAMDTCAAVQKHDRKRAAASGLEATLYGVAAWAGAATLADVWFPPLGIATGAIALVSFGLGLSMTATRVLRDDWKTVGSWFSKPNKIADTAPMAPSILRHSNVPHAVAG